MQNEIEQTGLVVSYYGSTIVLLVENGEEVTCFLRRNQELPVVGDWVKWEKQSDGKGIVLNIMPRRTLLSRGDGRDKQKPIAANVDLLVIVMAPLPVFSEYLIDRYLLASELLGINALILLNKADLLDENNKADLIERLRIYESIPYPIALTSVYSSDGLSHLRDILKEKTAVLIGPSGVGKSSMIASLTEGHHLRIGEVSKKGTGKHTTTSTQLYRMENSGALIDSPGVREFHLWPLNKNEILQGFKEFKPFIGHCQFRDCLHIKEPNCAVQEAISSGKISAKRFQSYVTLMAGKK
jgi:ribosome biogenesis GTPase